MLGIADPIELGLVKSLAHPGTNVTGVVRLIGPTSAKQVELLKNLVPSASRIAVLVDSSDSGSPSTPLWLRDVQTVANHLALDLHRLDISRADQFEPAFAEAARVQADAVLVLPGLLMRNEAVRIAELAARARLPALYPQRDFVFDGGLLSYAEDFGAVNKRAAIFVDRILHGARPADLPVELPTTFELVVNTKALQTLGLTLPPEMAAQVTVWV
jgi:putative ABC transport system substrate-binding protein